MKEKTCLQKLMFASCRGIHICGRLRVLKLEDRGSLRSRHYEMWWA